MLLKKMSVATVIFSISLNAHEEIIKHVFDNGFTLLVKPINTEQSVSTQLWVNVGSAHESLHQKGLAHYLEHMVFKGTDTMSESDIPLIVSKLSGTCNATTSFDWTRFYFNFPQQHWHYAIPLLADIFKNCTFKQELLNAELKVVIQELKMNKDRYSRTLLEAMLSTLFPDHPYHYPVIGYKHDLCAISHETLLDFYTTHYQPDNAVLVVVGNLTVQEVINQAERYFGAMKNTRIKKQKSVALPIDSVDTLTHHAVTMYREIQNPVCFLAFKIPGLQEDHSATWDLLSILLAKGKNSSLYKLLVDDLKLASSIRAYQLGLFERDLFIIEFNPFREDDCPKIIEHILQELKHIADQGPETKAVFQASKTLLKDFYLSGQDTFEQASTIAEFFLGTGTVFNNDTYMKELHDTEMIQRCIKSAVKEFLHASNMHTGYVLSMNDQEKIIWQKAQEASDAYDAEILKGKTRESSVEEGKLVNTIQAQKPSIKTVAIPQELYLKNGLRVLWYNNQNVPTVSIGLQLKADNDYVPPHLQGLFSFLCAMMLEGTTSHTSQELVDIIKSHALSLSIEPGLCTLNALSQDLPLALTVLREILTECTFPLDAVEKVRQKMLVRSQNFFDSPSLVATNILYTYLYGDHPFSRNPVGNATTISAIQRDDLINFYKSHIVPDDACLVIVGDLKNNNITALVQEIFESWHYKKIEPIAYSDLSNKTAATFTHQMNRDQVVLKFATLSIDRFDKDFDALFLFNYIFGAGINSKLFTLREQTGAFYSIHGSVIHRSSHQPGVAFIETMVSHDRLEEVEKLIRNFIETVPDTLTQEDIETARNTYLYRTKSRYATNDEIANLFLHLHIYKLPFDYFVTRATKFEAITVDDVKNAVKKILDPNKMTVVKVGRIY